MNPQGLTVGMLGGGQLGRMSLLAGRHLGLRFVVFDPSPSACAQAVADQVFTRPYDDLEALDAFAGSVHFATLEFENVPREAAERVAQVVPLRPGPRALAVCQHRLREKTFLKETGVPHAPFEVAQTPAELVAALAAMRGPCVVKTAAFGYDGKGQVKVDDPGRADPEAIWSALQDPPGVVVERWIEHQGEVSVIVARGVDGKTACFPMAENLHRDHILFMSIVPARVSPELMAQGQALAVQLAEALDVVGLLAVEMFVTQQGLLVNEMAPRPHNSGHVTIEACRTSQFEQHMRAVVGLPLGSTELHGPAVMVNLLGDLWAERTPDFGALLQDSNVALHLYDKGAARPGRKMGHFTVRAGSVQDALHRAEQAFAGLSSLGG